MYENLIVDKDFTAPNQAWAVDISYLRLENEFCYLALVKDLYSHKIIGYDISNSLGAEGFLRALKMALKEGRVPQGLIHHSDNGLQYEAKEYKTLLQKHGIEISRAAKGCPWENGSMERTIGRLKMNMDWMQFLKMKSSSQRFFGKRFISITMKDLI